MLLVDEMEKGASVEPVVRDFQESTPSEESLPKGMKEIGKWLVVFLFQIFLAVI